MLFRLNKKRGSRQKAFSIIEVLFATFIVTVGLTAVIQLLASSLANSLKNRDAIVAAGLAQEGIEIAYNVRDNNYINDGSAFPTSGPDTFPGASNRDFCRLGYDERSFVLNGPSRTCFSNTTSSGMRFSLLLQGGFYAFSPGQMKFARVIAIERDPAATPTWATATSIVWWGDSSVRPTDVFQGPSSDQVHTENCTLANHCVFSRATLTDWR